MTEKWRIEQLSELVGKALGDFAQDSGRVRDVPDVRTIRYYTTLGLLDRPVEMQGRTAFYGRRHVLQLVAIKRLQSQGLSLVEVQETLAGAGDKKLTQLADLSPEFFAEADVETVKRRSVDGRTQRKYWAQAPDVTADRPATVVPTPRPAVILPLGDGVSLVIEGALPDQIDESAVKMLRDALTRTGIVTKEKP
jgi:DNA-binding transcriptional MerR regulator